MKRKESPRVYAGEYVKPNTKHCDDATSCDRQSKLIAIETRYTQSINPLPDATMTIK